MLAKTSAMALIDARDMINICGNKITFDLRFENKDEIDEIIQHIKQYESLIIDGRISTHLCFDDENGQCRNLIDMKLG